MSTVQTKKPFLIIFILLGVGIITWFLFRMDPTENLIGENREQDPDTYMFGVTSTEMDEHGRPKQQVSATQVVHYPLDDVYLLDAPHAILFEDGIKQWEITARQGRSRNSQTEIEMWNDVQAQRYSHSDETQPLRIHTAYMHYWPERAYAETDQFVHMTQPDMTLNSVGLRLYLDEERAELLSQVKQIQAP